MTRALLCNIMILIVQELNFSKLRLQQGGSKGFNSLISFPTRLPREDISGAALLPRLQICTNHVSIPVQNVRGRSSPQGRAHVQSSGSPNEITAGSTNHMTLYEHVYMMRLASAEPLCLACPLSQWPHNEVPHPKRTPYTRQHKVPRHLSGVTSCKLP
jgi:hypothetical protein